jgi:cell division protein FtsZ
LSEFEEVLKIITASADKEALIIAGTSINSSLDEQIKVTVIATGFNGGARKPVQKEEVEAEEKADIISYDEWIKMRKGVSAASAGAGAGTAGPSGTAGNKGPGDFLVGRNSKEADLNVPTVLRGKKYLQQGDG